MLAVVVATALCVATLRAADDSEQSSAIGTVTGKVVDPAGNPAADCIVTATENAKKMRSPKDVASDADGKFTIELPECKWNLNFRTRDAKMKGVKSVEVLEGRTVDVGTVQLKAKK